MDAGAGGGSLHQGIKKEWRLQEAIAMTCMLRNKRSKTIRIGSRKLQEILLALCSRQGWWNVKWLNGNRVGSLVADSL